VTGVRSAIPARTLPAGPGPTGRAAGIALIRDRGGAGLLTTSYAAGSAPVIARRSAEPQSAAERDHRRSAAGNVHLPAVINSVPYRSSRPGFPGREYATAARQLICGRGIGARLLEDQPHSRRRERLTQAGQIAVNAPVPQRVIPGHLLPGDAGMSRVIRQQVCTLARLNCIH
jgi:hypothetical protein